MKKLDLIEDRWLSIKEIAEYLGVRREAGSQHETISRRLPKRKHPPSLRHIRSGVEFD